MATLFSISWHWYKAQHAAGMEMAAPRAAVTLKLAWITVAHAQV